MSFDFSILYLILFALGCLGIALSTFLVPVLASLTAQKKELQKQGDAKSLTSLDVLIPAHNEEDNIITTLQSIRESAHRAKISVRIWVGADSCTDKTVARAEEFGAKVVAYSFRSKWKTLSALVALSDAEHIALVDAGTSWSADLLTQARDTWTDDVVGVAPTYRSPRAGVLRRMHWAFEAFLKNLENRMGGPISVHGATIFYRRQELVETLAKLPKEEIWKNDDVVIPTALRILYPQLRIVYLKDAVVHDLCVLQNAGERGRRLRMVQGNLEIMTRLLPALPGPGFTRAFVLYARRAGRIFWAWWLVLVMCGIWGYLGYSVVPLLVGIAAVSAAGALGITGSSSAFFASLVAPVVIVPSFAGRIGWRDSDEWLRRPPRIQNPVSWATYVIVISAGWASAALYLRPVYSMVSEAYIFGWAGVTALTTVLLLSLMNFFGPFMVVPRRREMLTLSLVAPIPGMFWKLFFFNIYGQEVVRLREVLLAAPLVALLAVLFRYFEHHRIFRKGPLVLAAALSPDEVEHLTDYLIVSGFREKIRLVEWSQILSGSLVPYSLVYSRSALRDLQADGAVLGAIFSGLPAIELRRLAMQLTGRADVSTLDTWFFLQVTGEKSIGLKAYDAFKRFNEPVCAMLALILLFPFLLLVGALVKLTSQGPMLYSQWRSGHMGTRFKLHKFRTMRTDAEAAGPRWAASKDPRVTRLGAILRKTRIDELPQLWNIVIGELSFVGPRPERPEIVDELVKSIPVFPLRLIVKPGVSGWAQVNYGYVGSVEESRTKLEYDLYYILHRSLWLDLHILLKTISTFWKGGTGR
jgi:lipopolysaccharide/colanic/teichoic acid biosynthesis glycosyltransferase/glycosyltransferase involved in cell wall biosynthesis